MKIFPAFLAGRRGHILQRAVHELFLESKLQLAPIIAVAWGKTTIFGRMARIAASAAIVT